MAGVISTTETSALLTQAWTPGLREEATEEMEIVRDFSGADGVQKIMGQLNIRKIKRQSVQALAASGGTGTGLVYNNNTEVSVSCTPTWVYGAVEINRAVYNRLDLNPDNPYRNMLKYGLGEYIDQLGAALAAGLSTNVKGSGLSSMDKGLALDAEQALAISAKRFFKPGVTPWYLKIHPSQLKNLMSVFDLTADYVRGDAEKPLVSGWMSKVLGATINESGNVYQSGGVTHNLGFIPEAFVIAYNEEMTVLTPQEYELVTRLIATAEVGVVEVFDEYGVDIQTAA